MPHRLFFAKQPVNDDEMRKVHLHLFCSSIQKARAKTPVSRKLPFVMSLRALVRLSVMLTSAPGQVLVLLPSTAFCFFLVSSSKHVEGSTKPSTCSTNGAFFFFTGGCKHRVKRAAFLLLFIMTIHHARFFHGTPGWKCQSSRK